MLGMVLGLRKKMQKIRIYLTLVLLISLCAGSVLIACTGSCVHNWKFHKVLNESDCTEEGHAEYVCKECGETMAVALPILEHEENLIEEAYASCEEDGYRKYACRKCNKVRIEIISATRHRYAKTPVYTLAATCFTEGKVKYVCEECGMEKEYELKAKGHRYLNGICDVCGFSCPDQVDGTEGFAYRKTEGGYILTGRSESRDVNIVVPARYRGEAVIGIGDAAFSGQQDILSVVFPETLKEIGERAFFGCRGLSELNLPKSLERIEDNAFADCVGIKEIRADGNLAYLGSSAFYGCTELECFLAGEKIGTVGRFAFNSCPNLQTVYLNTHMAECIEENNEFGNLIGRAKTLYLPKNALAVSPYLTARFQKAGEADGYDIYAKKT